MDSTASPPPSNPLVPSRGGAMEPSVVSAVSTLISVTRRATREELKERQRKSRRSRVEKSKNMGRQVDELEKLTLALRVLPDPDNVWDEFIDSDTKKLRGDLRRLLAAIRETKKLTFEKVQLQQLIAEHKTSGLMLQYLLQSYASVDDWETKTLAWKELTRRHFRPRTEQQVAELTAHAVAESNQFTCGRHNTPGLSYLGWATNVRFLHGSTIIHFIQQKKMQGYNLDQHLAVAWQIYSDEATYHAVVLGGRGRVSLDIVQRIKPTAWIIRVAEELDQADVVLHKLLLLAHVETEEGAVFCIKSLEDIDLQREINSGADWWMRSATWSRYENMEPDKGRDSTHFRMSIGGLWDVVDSAAFPKWYAVILGIATRAEAAGKGHWQLTFD